MLRFLGRLFKGKATLVGSLVTVVATAAAQSDVGAAIGAVQAHGPAVIAGVGAILTAFGIGRKAGHAAGIELGKTLPSGE